MLRDAGETIFDENEPLHSPYYMVIAWSIGNGSMQHLLWLNG